MKILIFLLATGIFCSCNLKPNSIDNVPVNLIDTVQHHQESVGDALTLNNSTKWNTDSVTNNNVDNLQSLISNIKKEGINSLPGYQKAAGDLQMAITKIINECRMKGPDHDVLHKWLHPLLKQVNEFKQLSTIIGAEAMLEGISKQVNLYYNYFE